VNKDIKYFIFTFIFSTQLFAAKEKIFPDNDEDYRTALVWYDEEHNLYVLFGIELIQIDSWHYPNIED
jgi:hypothetical protein